jgi:hypothetical protein
VKNPLLKASASGSTDPATKNEPTAAEPAH